MQQYTASNEVKKTSIHQAGLKVMTLILTLFLTIDGIAQHPQTSPFDNFIPASPGQNYIPNSNYPQSVYPQITGMEQYGKDRQEQLRRQEQNRVLGGNPASKPTPSSTAIKYTLPSCSEQKGADAYLCAFTQLSEMASGEKKFSLKKANFIVENAFFENKADFQQFDKIIRQLALFVNLKMDELGYDKTSNLAKNVMLFRFFSDTLKIKSKNMVHYPIPYDFEDCEGSKDWRKMFVSKTLAANSGQCHSLPLLYLILADEIGAKAQLAYSPRHSYIKFRDDSGKWHNIELTNGMFTTDAFILQSGYIKAEALQSKIYMQPLTEKQLLSHLLFDLAKGYTVKYCFDRFVEKVVTKALELDPNNIEAHALLSDYRTVKFNHIEKQLGGINEQNYRQKLSQHPQAKEAFLARNRQYRKMDDMGYENMPADAYEKWLKSLNEARQKQQDKELQQQLNKSIPIKNPEIKR